MLHEAKAKAIQNTLVGVGIMTVVKNVTSTQYCKYKVVHKAQSLSHCVCFTYSYKLLHLRFTKSESILCAKYARCDYQSTMTGNALYAC